MAGALRSIPVIVSAEIGDIAERAAQCARSPRRSRLKIAGSSAGNSPAASGAGAGVGVESGMAIEAYPTGARAGVLRSGQGQANPMPGPAIDLSGGVELDKTIANQRDQGGQDGRVVVLADWTIDARPGPVRSRPQPIDD